MFCLKLFFLFYHLFSIQSRGLCDIRQRPCKITTVFGEKFLDSSNLTCHMEFFKVSETIHFFPIFIRVFVINSLLHESFIHPITYPTAL